jgi:hypothetical protein
LPVSEGALAEETFFDHPWPSDLRRGGDGTVNFEGWPTPSSAPLVSDLVAATKGLFRA